VNSDVPIVKDLVLIGGGHSHVAVLKQFGMRPVTGVRLTLVSRHVDTPYSGMLPGLIAGHYAPDDAHIDLERLARFAGARAVFDEAIGLDPSKKVVLFRERPPIAFDVLSINIGSTPHATVPGVASHATPVKPIDRFLDRWMDVQERLRTATGLRRIAVVGGGAGGVELLLAIQWRLRTLLAGEGRSDTHLHYALYTDTETILPTYNDRVRRIFGRVLGDRGVKVHVGSAVTEIRAGQLCTADGLVHAADEIFWATHARAAPWLAASGLGVDSAGFVRVGDTLESVSHSHIFAAGDVASVDGHPRPKSGVFAVRQGRPLADNLRAALRGRALTDYRPRRKFLSLVSTGNRHAVVARGSFVFQGEWVWFWKSWIDRRFMRRFNELPDMPELDRPRAGGRGLDLDGALSISDSSFRCGGCGAKVGATVLDRVLRQVQTSTRDDVVVGIAAPDDAAVLRVPAGRDIVQTVDFFRAIVDDPYVFGQIAANHALGDVYAMGGTAQSALAIVTVPFGPEDKTEQMLTHLLTGAVAVLDKAGAALVGGHTSEGAELALGFAVNGVVDPARVLRKAGLQVGDSLILTKAIGTGTLFAADMRHRARGRWIVAAIDSMLQSSRDAARCVTAHGATACTDVTGFGLLGHLVELLRASSVNAQVNLAHLPVLAGAEETVALGFLSSLQPQNIRASRAIEDPKGLASEPRFALLFDPQTAGGLLAGIPAAATTACLAELRALGYIESAIIGTVVAQADEVERVRLSS